MGNETENENMRHVQNAQDVNQPEPSRSQAKGNIASPEENGTSAPPDPPKKDKPKGLLVQIKKNLVMISIIAIFSALTVLGANSHRIFSKHTSQISYLNAVSAAQVFRESTYDKSVGNWKQRNWFVRTFFVSRPNY